MSKAYVRNGSPYYWVTSGSGQSRVRNKIPLLVRDYTLKQVQKIIDRKTAKEFLCALGIISDSVPLSKLLCEYKNEVDIRYSYVPDSVKAIKTIVQRFADYIGDDRNVYKINSADVEMFLLKRFNNGIAISTVKKDKVYIGQMFDLAKSRSWVEENPVKLVRKNLLPKETDKNRKIVRKPILLSFVFHAIDSSENETDKRFWLVMLFTGVDPGDASSIKPHQINDQNHTVTFVRGKNGESTDVIPLHPRLLEFDLVDIIPDCTKSKIRKSREKFKDLVRKAGYKGDVIDFKCLRHTFNDLLSAEGMGEFDRSKLLGHSAVRTNQSYTHFDVERLRKIIDRIG